MWIDSVGFRSGKFVLNTLSPENGKEEFGLETLSLPWYDSRGTRFRVTTDCSTWEKVSAEAFWDALGIDPNLPLNQHSVFAFEAAGKRYLLPANLLISTMMRPIQKLHRFLFKPQGLDSFSLPIKTETGPSVDFWTAARSIVGVKRDRAFGNLAVLSWMHCFPSARAMWSSVYLGGCNGRLDLAPPKARLTATLYAKKRGQNYLVTTIQLVRLEALEAPYPFAEGHSSEIVIHASALLERNDLHKPQFSIPARKGTEWKLSDAEWTAIKPIFSDRHQKKFALRTIVDCILTKLGSQQGWLKLDYGDLNFSIVQATYRRMIKRGEWSHVTATLSAMRKHLATSE